MDLPLGLLQRRATLVQFLGIKPSNACVFFFPLQLILFGLSNQLVVSYKEESTMAFKQLFIENYGGQDEDDYSASVFTQQDFYNSVSFVMEQVGPAHSACLVWGCR